eukprot:TRINITY_DN821_c0_g1_i6.p2 TRINITY_DN821_c0_g1~~TRINITY_DN821_c0_g1_i6.p2  ORF type:complete len:116 (-),score=23.94 TRINITY_DN821_c0_g1_i6:320-667(-)
MAVTSKVQLQGYNHNASAARSSVGLYLEGSCFSCSSTLPMHIGSIQWSVDWPSNVLPQLANVHLSLYVCWGTIAVCGYPLVQCHRFGVVPLLLLLLLLLLMLVFSAWWTLDLLCW